MKKRSGLLFYFSFLCIFLCSCNKDTPEKTVENHIYQVASENDHDYILTSLQMDREYIDLLVCILDDNIIYASYENDDRILAFYKYNIKENQTYHLGNIADPFVDSGDLAAIDHSIFFYRNKLIVDSDNPDGKLEHSLYQIDLRKNTLQMLSNDDSEQTLIYLDALNEKLFR